MTVSTDIPTIVDSVSTVDPVTRWQDSTRAMRSVILRAGRTTADWNDYRRECVTSSSDTKPHATIAAPLASAVIPREVEAGSTTLEVWEGTVLSLDRGSGVMQVFLDAKIEQLPRYAAEIALESVSVQDRNLVRPGAVFYLMLYRRTMPSVENTLELRFRRRLPWTAVQLARVEQGATMVLAKMRGPALPAFSPLHPVISH